MAELPVSPCTHVQIGKPYEKHRKRPQLYLCFCRLLDTANRNSFKCEINLIPKIILYDLFHLLQDNSAKTAATEKIPKPILLLLSNIFYISTETLFHAQTRPQQMSLILDPVKTKAKLDSIHGMPSRTTM